MKLVNRPTSDSRSVDPGAVIVPSKRTLAWPRVMSPLASNQVVTVADWLYSSTRVTVPHGIVNVPLSSNVSTSGLAARAGVAAKAVSASAASAALMVLFIPRTPS